MYKYLIPVLFFLPACLKAQSSDGGYAKALELKKNVVRITADSKNGFGFIVALRNGYAYIVTARHVVDSEPSSISVNYYDYPGEEYTVEKNFRTHQSYDLALLKVKTPPGLRWEKRCYSEIVSPNTLVWFIGRNGEWYVPTKSLVGSINNAGPDNKIYVDITSVQPGTSGAPLINQNGINGLIYSDDLDRTEALSLKLIKFVITSEWQLPFELESNDQEPPNTKCNVDLKYLGLGKNMAGFDVQLGVVVKKVKFNGKTVPVPATFFPLRLVNVPCGIVSYEIEADVTDNVKFWIGKGSGQIELEDEGSIFINWIQSSQTSVKLTIDP